MLQATLSPPKPAAPVQILWGCDDREQSVCVSGCVRVHECVMVCVCVRVHECAWCSCVLHVLYTGVWCLCAMWCWCSCVRVFFKGICLLSLCVVRCGVCGDVSHSVCACLLCRSVFAVSVCVSTCLHTHGAECCVTVTEETPSVAES